MCANRFLTTRHLYFRRFTPHDAPLLYALDSDPEVMRYISKGQPTPLARIEQELLPQWMRYSAATPYLGYWAAHETASGEFIGWFHLRPDRDHPQDIELGYRLRRQVWGQGYATEGARALIALALAHQVGRIVARTLVGNTASRRVMEKCGLQCEEYFTYDANLLPGWSTAERQAVKYGWPRDRVTRAPAQGI
jgi:RimJ/RimL family protein N-acetyltransferase